MSFHIPALDEKKNVCLTWFEYLSWSCLCTTLWSMHVEHHICNWFMCMHSIDHQLWKCCKGLGLYDQNEFRHRVKFVMHSHDKIQRLSQRHSCWPGFHATSDTHAPLAPNYLICEFQCRTRFVFSLHDTKIKFYTRMTISQPLGNIVKT